LTAGSGDTEGLALDFGSIIVGGAGILGLWQALRLAEAGHRVSLVDAATNPLAANASRYAGAMLAPDCEGEAAPEIVRELGYRGLSRWREVLPGLVNRGTLVVAQARDRSEIVRFSRMTRGYEWADAERISALEPDLAGRFAHGLHSPDEAHMSTPEALLYLLDRVRAAGVDVCFSTPLPEDEAQGALVVDCTGLAATPRLSGLRGVRGERVLLRSADVRLSRPVRLLHPRHPLYVVPWGDGRYLVGATVIESDDAGQATVRSALELLGAAYALHPGFGEAEILEIGAGVRPAFADNVPRIRVSQGGRRIDVNGAYRHGYLLAPVLADAVADLVSQVPGADRHPLMHSATGIK